MSSDSEEFVSAEECEDSKKISKENNRIPSWLRNTNDFETEVKKREKYRSNYIKSSEILSEFVCTLKGGNDEKKRDRRTKSIQDSFDVEMSDIDDLEDTDSIYFETTPLFIKGGKLRDYQISGLNWMASLYNVGLNGILADEMGLGKTIQTIAFLGYLKYYTKMKGPFLVIAPKSTLRNWCNEFDKWCPSLKVIMFGGSKEERKEMLKDAILVNRHSWDVLLTSYEIIMTNFGTLKRIIFQSVVIDEAHRIKSGEARLTKCVRKFETVSRLLLTGTPLQNNMKELWTLLNFIIPDIFSSFEKLEEWNAQSDSNSEKVIQQMQNLLEPFLLRRVKQDVETALLPKKEYLICATLSDKQREMYKAFLLNSTDLLESMCTGSLRMQSLNNIFMQLRKLCNHPYLFHGVEPGPPYEFGEHTLLTSGKMIILDKLLTILKSQGSRVLIFSQMVRMLDILEEYVEWKGYEYCRLDGNSSHEERCEGISKFNAPNSPIFVFLLSTRAGGLGINLQTADAVIFYDNDFNPQMDLQAADRVHRIGQRKQVRVFKLVIEKTVEQRVLEISYRKLEMSKLFMRQGIFTDMSKHKISKEELYEAIRRDTQDLFNKSIVYEQNTDLSDFDQLIKSAEEKSQEFNEKIQESLADFDPINFQSTQNTTEIRLFEGEYYGTGKKTSNKNFREPIIPLSAFSHNQMRSRRNKSDQSTSYLAEVVPDLSIIPSFEDFQFVPDRVVELITKGRRSTTSFSFTINPTTYPHLSAEEITELSDLLSNSFYSWSSRHFASFVSACMTHGRDDRLKVSQSVPGKSPEEVLKYLDAFENRQATLIGKCKASLLQIERAEKRLKNKRVRDVVLSTKMKEYKVPLLKMDIRARSSNSRGFTAEFERYLLCRVYELGESNPDTFKTIYKEVQTSSRFRFNWFLRSCSITQLRDHTKHLIGLLAQKHMKVMNERNVNVI